MQISLDVHIHARTLHIAHTQTHTHLGVCFRNQVILLKCSVWFSFWQKRLRKTQAKISSKIWKVRVKVPFPGDLVYTKPIVYAHGVAELCPYLSVAEVLYDTFNFMEEISRRNRYFLTFIILPGLKALTFILLIPSLSFASGQQGTAQHVLLNWNATNIYQSIHQIKADTLSFLLVYFLKVLPYARIFSESYIITSPSFPPKNESTLQHAAFVVETIQPRILRWKSPIYVF